jgi:Holliday junction resolvase RusA-like endonuclease
MNTGTGKTCIAIVVTGHPVAKARARSSVIPKRGGGFVADAAGRPIIHHHTPEKTRKWEADAKDQARAAMGETPPLQGPLSVEVVAYFAPAQSWSTWKQQAAHDGRIAHTSRPDADNIGKAAKDALNGVAWIDDSQVTQVSVEKRFSDKPRVEIYVRKTGQAGSQVTRKDQIESRT